MKTALRYITATICCFGGATAANAYPMYGWMFGWWGCIAAVLVMGGRLQGELK